MSDGRSSETARQPRPGGRRWRRRLAALGLGILVFWGVPEAVVRIADPLLEKYTEIVFLGDPNSPLLFMKDPYLHWKLRPNVSLEFLGVAVRTNAEGFRGGPPAEGRRNVLCLGDSGTFGWQVAEEEAFPSRLAALLNERGGGTWQAINAGVPGYSSFQAATLAEGLIERWKPEAVVICVGNNDPAATKRGDRDLARDRRFAAPATALLSHSRFLVWLYERIAPTKVETFLPDSRQVARIRVSPDELAENLREMIRLARRAGAQPVLVAPPVNLWFAPRVSDQVFPEWREWTDLARRVQQFVLAGRLDDALTEAEKVLAEHPDHFYALWLKGIVLYEKGDPAAGATLEEAFEKHPFPERAKRSYRQVIERVAREEGVDFLNVPEVFRAVADGPAGAASLYLDWCHPTPLGHDIIARRLAGILASPRKPDKSVANPASRPVQ